jgi:hypothetical protein
MSELLTILNRRRESVESGTINSNLQAIEAARYVSVLRPLQVVPVDRSLPLNQMFSNLSDIRERCSEHGALNNLSKGDLIKIIIECKAELDEDTYNGIVGKYSSQVQPSPQRRASVSNLDDDQQPELTCSSVLYFVAVSEQLTTPFLFLAFEDGKWSIPQTAKDIFGGFPTDGKGLKVIAVAGGMRKGKSYIMNRLAGQQGGFAIGGSVNSCTHGIWAWFLPRDPHKFDGVDTLLIDTEGMFDIKRQDRQIDQQLFVAALVLSSLVVYNVLPNIDETAIEELGLATRMAQQVFKFAESSSTSYNPDDALFPTLFWLVRDFFLSLRDYDNNPDTYLSHCLDLVPNNSEYKVNACRSVIRGMFPKMKCITMCPPNLADPRLMQAIDQQPFESLPERFRHDTIKAVNSIRKHATVKRIMKPGCHDDPNVATIDNLSSYILATPSLLCCYGEMLCDAFNSNTIPKLDNMWEAASRRACSEALATSVAKLMSSFHDFESSLKPQSDIKSDVGECLSFGGLIEAVSDDVLSAIVQKAQRDVIIMFTAPAMGPFFERTKMELEEKIERETRNLKARNYERSLKLLSVLLQKSKEHVNDLVNSNALKTFHEFLGLSNYVQQGFSNVACQLGPAEQASSVELAAFFSTLCDQMKLKFEIDDITRQKVELEERRQAEALLAAEQEAKIRQTLKEEQEKYMRDMEAMKQQKAELEKRSKEQADLAAKKEAELQRALAAHADDQQKLSQTQRDVDNLKLAKANQEAANRSEVERLSAQITTLYADVARSNQRVTELANKPPQVVYQDIHHHHYHGGGGGGGGGGGCNIL